MIGQGPISRVAISVINRLFGIKPPIIVNDCTNVTVLWESTDVIVPNEITNVVIKFESTNVIVLFENTNVRAQCHT